jgi:hypothetical protein
MSVNAPATVTLRDTINHGVLAGLLGCAFGVLGIFAWGLIFVPLAAICSFVGLLRAAGGLSLSGIGCSLLGGILTAWGFVASPSLWVLLGAGLLAAHSPAETISPPLITGRSFSPPASIQTGPNSTYTLQQAAEEAKAGTLACKSRRLFGELKTYAASALCSNPAIIGAYKQANYRYMDLIYLFAAKRLELAEKLDSKQLTEAQFEAEYAQLANDVTNEERQRDKGLR